MAKTVKPIYLGNVPLGGLGVDLYADPTSSGGMCDSRDERTGRLTVTVGILENWAWTMGVIAHEAFEMSAMLRGLHYTKTTLAERDAATGILLSMTHEQFTEVTNDVGTFMSKAVPLLAGEHRKLHGGKR